VDRGIAARMLAMLIAPAPTCLTDGSFA